jgi:thiopeptide-type bacteriocin biosynthesis protein
MGDTAEVQHGNWLEVSVRMTDPVSYVIEEARGRSVACGELLASLQKRYPSTDPATIETFISELIEYGILHTSLRAPTWSADSLSTVVGRLAGGWDGGLSAKLLRIGEAVSAYERTSLSAGLGALATVERTAAEEELSVGSEVIHVDLVSTETVVLPECVASEVERCANFLRRTVDGTDPFPHLSEYRMEFLERYGTNQAVPLTVLLDPERGMGAPAGYRHPRGPRRLQGHAPGPSGRDDLLIELAQTATMEGLREVEVAGKACQLLEAFAPSVTPPTIELGFSLLAGSLEDVEVGAFRLVLSRRPWLPPAGATASRFAGALSMEEEFGRLARLNYAYYEGAVPVQVDFSPVRGRAANIMRAPRWLQYTVVVGAFAERGRPDVVSLEDLAVAADEKGLFIVSESLGREVVPFAFHMGNLVTQAPNHARFLLEVGECRRSPWQPWSWGWAASSPYLPRLRFGKTIVASAQWVPDMSVRCASSQPFNVWREAFEEWRHRWQVPDAVQLVVGDLCLDVRLDLPLHLQIVRDELRKRPRTRLLETPSGGAFGSEWIGGRAHEIIFAFAEDDTKGLRTPPATRSLPVVRRPHSAGRHLAGGEWLYVKLYCSVARQNECLRHGLQDLLEECAGKFNRWFFVRYRDPHDHLRLRFHGDSRLLHGEVLPILHRWASELVSAGLAQRMVLDCYEQELERYGGPTVMSLAEDVFAADSALCIAVWSMVPEAEIGRHRPSAVDGYLAILEGFFGDSWARSVLENGVFEAASSQGPTGSDHQAPAVEAGHEARKQLVLAAHAYAGALQSLLERGEATQPPADAALSLLHMHHNRMVGIDRVDEARSLRQLRKIARRRLVGDGT